jgi:hypothetical protein
MDANRSAAQACLQVVEVGRRDYRPRAAKSTRRSPFEDAQRLAHQRAADAQDLADVNLQQALAGMDEVQRSTTSYSNVPPFMNARCIVRCASSP